MKCMTEGAEAGKKAPRSGWEPIYGRNKNMHVFQGFYYAFEKRELGQDGHPEDL